jgi:hypothetical protein
MFEASPGAGEVVDMRGPTDQLGAATGLGAANAATFIALQALVELSQ